MRGPAKYDQLASILAQALQADGLMLVVIGGKLGNGVSCHLTAEAFTTMPDMLRDVANQVEDEIRHSKIAN